MADRGSPRKRHTEVITEVAAGAGLRPVFLASPSVYFYVRKKMLQNLNEGGSRQILTLCGRSKFKQRLLNSDSS